jgi:predicted TIM-barrel fold metal-dependent hydrolase
MGMPTDVSAIDLMMNIPEADTTKWYSFLEPLLMDEESKKVLEMPAGYMFRNIPDVVGPDDDYVAACVAEMDKHNVGKAMLGIHEEAHVNKEALRRFPDRFFPSISGNPNRGMEGVREIVRYHEEYGVKAVTAFPAGNCPQVPLNDARWYPIYAKCVELDIPFVTTVGVPGPRVPMHAQKVEHLDEICWFFPELRVVMRHGAEPWVDLAVKLMLKYPNLYYCTSAFAPRHYPEEIIKFANSRGARKIMYAGYFPMGLSLERIFEEMQDVPFNDDVWPLFLRENAQRVFKID